MTKKFKPPSTVLGFLLILACLSIQARGQDDVYVPNPSSWSDMDSGSAEAAMKFIKSAKKCRYVYDAGSVQTNNQVYFGGNPSASARPTIAKFQDPKCPNQERSVCAGKVVCEQESLNLVLGQVYCLSRSPNQCPDAKSCALDTKFSRNVSGGSGAIDGGLKKPTAFFGQKFRGGSPIERRGTIE